MRVIIRIGRAARYPKPLLFAYAPPRTSGKGLVLSLAMHVAAIAAYPGAARLAQALRGPDLDLSTYSVRPLRLLIPDSPRGPEPRDRLAAPRDGAQVESLRAQLGVREATPPEGRVARLAVDTTPLPPPRSLELPPLPVLRDAGFAVIQPGYQVFLAMLKQQTGRVAVWSRRGAGLERLKGLILPDSSDGPAPPTSDIAPRLEIPNLVANAGDLNLAEFPPAAQPALPVTPSSTRLIRLMIPALHPAGSSDAVEARAGDLANVLLLSAPHPAEAEVIDLPAGSSAPQTGGGSDGSASEHGAVSSGAWQTAAQTGGGASATPRDVGPGGPADRAHGSLAALAGDARGPSAGAGEPARKPLRAYDVMVIQSSAADIFAGSAVTLSGKPVYTVYLDVGGGRPWLLQYCVPKGPATQIENRVIDLGELDSVEPPLALSTSLQLSSGKPCAQYTLVHGLLTEAGKFRNLRLIGGDFLTGWLHLLENWSFQPALQNKVPIEVEILLAIPPGVVGPVGFEPTTNGL